MVVSVSWWHERRQKISKIHWGRNKMAAILQHQFQMHFLENEFILLSPNFVTKGPNDNIPALVQIMAWRQPIDKSYEAMVVSLLTHIYVSRPQWVNLSNLTHWDRVTHICVGNLTIIGSDNGWSPDRRQAITWTNVGVLFIGPIGTTFSEMVIEIHTFSFKKIQLKMSSVKWRPVCLGLNVLKQIELYHVTEPKIGATWQKW